MSAGAVCRNCGAGLAGRYCSHCGQAADVHVPSTRELLHEALEGLTHSDSRIWLTLKCLLFKPGKLTLEFIAGRRAAYLPPFRLYLILSVVFFLIASFSHFHGQAVQIDLDEGVRHQAEESDCTNGKLYTGVPFIENNPAWKQRFQRACIGVVRDNGNSLLHAAVTMMPKAMFIFLPLIALLHMLLYWWPRYRYAIHLLFFLHLHAFFFLIATLLALSGNLSSAWPAWQWGDDHLSTVLFWVMFLYGLLAMRRVFEMGWWLAAIKACALFFVYVIVLGCTVAGVFMYAALQL